MTATLLLLLKISVGGIILAIGMGSTPRDMAYLWRRPGLLLRSLLAMYLLVPLASLTVAALAIGHGLGGPAAEDRTALAMACSTRHLGIAVLVAASLPGPRTAVIIAVYILTSAVISIPYLRWCRVAVSHSNQPGALP